MSECRLRVELPGSNAKQNSGLDATGDSFDYRQTSLPGSNGKQTQGSAYFSLFEPEHQDRFLAVTDRSQVDVVGRAKGRHEVHDVATVKAIRSKQRRWKEPRSPMIQVLLQQSGEYQARLAASPGLTRDALAKEVGLNPSYLTRILNLLRLAPEIQDHIRAMQPTVKIGRVTESRLKEIARIGDHGEQIRKFQRLVGEDEKLRVA